MKHTTEIPGREACLALLEAHDTPAHVRRHCLKVTETALRMGFALTETGVMVNLPLLQAAGLLHDVCRVEKDHWLAGAALLREKGWDAPAALVEKHMHHDLPAAGTALTELDLLCLADRMVREDEYVGLGTRMGAILERFRDKPGAEERIGRIVAESRDNKHWIEDRIGKTVEELFEEPCPVIPE